MRTQSLLLRLGRTAPIRLVSSAKLPTEYGDFAIHAFEPALGGETHIALVRGEIGRGENVLTRVHAQIFSSASIARASSRPRPQ